MALRVKKLFGDKAFEVLADKGYHRAKDLKKCTENGITVYITKQTYANGTKDPAFYSDQFKYDPAKNTYLCPAGKELPYYRARKKDGKVISIDSQTKRNIKKYKLRQMIIEQPFGTIKRDWGAYFFLTKKKVLVNAEIALSFLAYNFKRAIDILETEEILRRLKQKRKVILL